MRDRLRAAAIAVSLAGLGCVCRGETHAAVGSRVELSEPINPHYPGTRGAETLVDGVTGSLEFGKEYLGIEGPDLEVTVRLPAPTVVHVLAADFLQNTPPAIFVPVSVDFAVSENGRNFRTVATLRPRADEKQEGPLVERFLVEGLDLTAAAVRVRAANGGKVPPWHRSPQAERWIFISEVLVNPGETPASPMDLVRSYRFGSSRWPLVRVEDSLRRASPEERRRLCAELAGLLQDADAALDARRFCLEQLALFGSEEDTAAVAAAAGIPELAPAACKALAHLGGPGAEAALLTAAREGRPAVRGAALAALAARPSPRIVELAALLAEGAPIGDAAARAFAAAATPAAAEALAGALAGAPPERRLHLADAVMACADRLLAAGQQVPAAAAFAAVEQHAPGDVVRLAAVGGQVRCGRVERLAEILQAAGPAETVTARTALSLGASLVERFGPGPVEAVFGNLSEPARVAVLRAVGRRAAAEDVPWLLDRLAGAEASVRAAAATALAAAGGARAVAPLAALLPAEGAAERAAAVEALGRIAGDGVEEAILAAAGTASGPARRAFCSVLEARRNPAAGELLRRWAADPDPDLRRAAWKTLGALAAAGDLAGLVPVFAGLPADAAPDAEKALAAAARAEADADAAAGLLIAALREAPSDNHRGVLLGVLGGRGGTASLAAIRDHLRHASPAVRGAAARALAAWPDAEPAEALLAAAEAEQDERLTVLELRSALTLLEQSGAGLPRDAADALLKRAAPLARRDEERQLLVAAAGAVPCPGALEIVLKARETPALTAAADAALLRLAPALWPEAPAATRTALGQIAAAAAAEEHRKAAAEILGRLPPAEALQRLEAAPWVSLFDGNSLEGWRVVGGKPDAWTARDGILVAQPGGGGWLAAATEYADYLAELEFRLPPGGNSGFFLRPPLEGNPAFEGIEVQLLDDAAPQYAGLRPDQYCGSIYGIAAANPRVSRPAGEWQRLRVLCLGRRILVWLNGVPVAEADLEAHADLAERIPGIRRTSGFPGLQNEQGPIEFRNLRLKNLAP